MLKEDDKLKIDTKNDMELDLQNVNLGFESDSEGETQEVQGDYEENELDKSRDRSNTFASGTDSSDSMQRKMLSLNGKTDDQKKIRLLEDAKDALLEAVENLSLATLKVDNLK